MGRRSEIQHKEPVQLDLFIPYEYGYESKAVLTNNKLTSAKVVAFHNGRRSRHARPSPSEPRYGILSNWIRYANASRNGLVA